MTRRFACRVTATLIRGHQVILFDEPIMAASIEAASGKAVREAVKRFRSGRGKNKRLGGVTASIVDPLNMPR